ncbi:MAG: hypothetical protein K2Z80_33150 [Xanthobacteraceae bacterium]|nr:hypothetical protein [Xanthobacteraceae bacterium]
MGTNCGRLTFDDAVEVWLHHWTGRHQRSHRRALRRHAGRIDEVLKEKKHIGSREAAEKKRKASA